MSPEQRQLELFKEELAHNREQSKNNELANKIMNGEDLTPEEEKLQKCKTKDEVHRLKTNTMFTEVMFIRKKDDVDSFL